MVLSSPTTALVLILVLPKSAAGSFVSPPGISARMETSLDASRRDFLLSSACVVSSSLLGPKATQAGIDPNALRNLPVEGDTGGSATRLRQIEAVQRPASDLVNTPWEELPDGVQYREYREGKGEAGVYSVDHSIQWYIDKTRVYASDNLIPTNPQLSRRDPGWLWK